jgi:hypothetical protein
MYYRVDGRNYDFFTALAGVRGDGPEPRGFPRDASPFVKEVTDAWGGDGHSHSWYMAQEFVPIFRDHHLTEEEQAEVTIAAINSTYREDFAVAYILRNFLNVFDEPHTVRFVFWFDN